MRQMDAWQTGKKERSHTSKSKKENDIVLIMLWSFLIHSFQWVHSEELYRDINHLLYLALTHIYFHLETLALRLILP